jgi:hypothetical protein
MRVTLKSIGDLREYFGRTPREISLAEPATLLDLYQQIGQIWGPDLPAYLWDAQQLRFRGPVFLVVDGKAVQDLNFQLQDGMEIRILRAAAGG